MVQVGKDIYAFSNREKQTQVDVTYHSEPCNSTSPNKVRQCCKLDKPLTNFSVCSLRGYYLFLTGGYHAEHEELQKEDLTERWYDQFFYRNSRFAMKPPQDITEMLSSKFDSLWLRFIFHFSEQTSLQS